MPKYYAVVRLDTIEFDADDEYEAEGRVQEFLDELGAVDTGISWHDADYTVYVDEEV